MTARARLQHFSRSLSSTAQQAARRKMPAPKIDKVGPLPSEEAKWTELKKIEVSEVIMFRALKI